MDKKIRGWKHAGILGVLLVWLMGISVSAAGLSGDNSLESLGIITQGVSISPEFYYSTIEYEVTVPVGTAELELEPVTSNSSAVISDITGTVLDDKGEATTVITVTAENGSECSYYLYVHTAAAQTEAAQTEAETEKASEKETEPETEDPRYVKVERSLLEEAENTISTLKQEKADANDQISFLTKILYGLIAFCIVLLFIVINQILKKKNLKAQLKEYQSVGYTNDFSEEEARWEKEQEIEKEKSRKNKKEKPENADDPETIPKPSKARKKVKKLPEYEQEQPAKEYQPNSQKKDSDSIEITMIDL